MMTQWPTNYQQPMLDPLLEGKKKYGLLICLRQGGNEGCEHLFLAETNINTDFVCDNEKKFVMLSDVNKSFRFYPNSPLLPTLKVTFSLFSCLLFSNHYTYSSPEN